MQEAARKERLTVLIEDEGATASELKREMRRLLSYADSVRNAAKHERAEIASDLQELIFPLVAEVNRLKGQLAAARGKAASKGAQESPTQVDVDDTAEDVLRAGRPAELPSPWLAHQPVSTTSMAHTSMGGRRRDRSNRVQAGRVSGKDPRLRLKAGRDGACICAALLALPPFLAAPSPAPSAPFLRRPLALMAVMELQLRRPSSRGGGTRPVCTRSSSALA